MTVIGGNGVNPNLFKEIGIDISIKMSQFLKAHDPIKVNERGSVNRSND